jgi:hypothetical protein
VIGVMRHVMRQIDGGESDDEADGVGRRDVLEESVSAGGGENGEDNGSAAEQEHVQNRVEREEDAVIQPAARSGELRWTQWAKCLYEREGEESDQEHVGLQSASVREPSGAHERSLFLFCAQVTDHEDRAESSADQQDRRRLGGDDDSSKRRGSEAEEGYSCCEKINGSVSHESYLSTVRLAKSRTIDGKMPRISVPMAEA